MCLRPSCSLGRKDRALGGAFDPRLCVYLGSYSLAQHGLEFLQYGVKSLQFNSEQCICPHQDFDRLDPWFFFELQNC